MSWRHRHAWRIVAQFIIVCNALPPGRFHFARLVCLLNSTCVSSIARADSSSALAEVFATRREPHGAAMDATSSLMDVRSRVRVARPTRAHAVIVGVVVADLREGTGVQSLAGALTSAARVAQRRTLGRTGRKSLSAPAGVISRGLKSMARECPAVLCESRSIVVHWHKPSISFPAAGHLSIGLFKVCDAED